jgi:hypothetical protein
MLPMQCEPGTDAGCFVQSTDRYLVSTDLHLDKGTPYSRVQQHGSSCVLENAHDASGPINTGASTGNLALDAFPVLDSGSA